MNHRSLPTGPLDWPRLHDEEDLVLALYYFEDWLASEPTRVSKTGKELKTLYRSHSAYNLYHLNFNL